MVLALQGSRVRLPAQITTVELLNVAHGIHPRQPFDDTRVRGLARQLNDARATFRGHEGAYHGGLEKFEPREMENLPINLKERSESGYDPIAT